MVTETKRPGYTPPDPNSNRSKRRQEQRRRFSNHGEIGNDKFRTVIGTTGLKHMGGRIREEYLNAIKSWSTEVKLYLEMRDDPIVGAQLDAIKLPLQAASFDVEPAPGGGPNDEEAAEWLWQCMNNMDGQTWNSHVEDALESLDFGFALGEVVLDKRADGRLWLKNIDPRGQESLDRWEYDEAERDKLDTFVQLDPNTGETYTIPISKCVHFKFRGRKGNPQGKSILRALYRPYKFARNLEDLEGIGVERDVGGMPVAKLKEGGYEDNDITVLKAALKGLRKDEEVYLIEPEGVDIRAYAGGNKIYDVNVIIDRWHKVMLMRFFSQFLILGMGNVGTQALVKGSQDFFALALEAVQRYLLETWNLQLVPYLFRFNQWTGISGYPTIVWEKPGRVDLVALVNAMNTAINAKLLTPTDLDEDHIRNLADLPDLPEEERGGPRDVESPPMGGLFDLPERFDEMDRKFDNIEKELALAGR
jgi:phage gp29-like protein